MGIKPASDIFQSRMVGVFQPMEHGKPTPYIDDIFHGKGNTFGEHLAILAKIFRRLLEARMQVNPDKSTLCGQSVEFLGFRLQTYEEANRSHPQTSPTHESQENSRISGNHQLYKKPHTQSCVDDGANHKTHKERPTIYLGSRASGFFQSDPSSSREFHPMCLPQPEQAIHHLS